MAGNYTDVPDHRIEYDRDGSTVLKIRYSDSVITELSNTDRQNLNDEDTDAISFSTISDEHRQYVILFPELRDIVGYWTRSTGSAESTAPAALEKSSNTTNGVDGTWATIVNPWVRSAVTIKPDYRSAIQAISALGIKAVRFNMVPSGSHTWSVQATHLYGTIASGETKYLTVWRPNTAAGSEDTGDSAADGAHFDWGDVPRSSSADRKFRIKNEHSSLTANSIVVSFEALSDTTPSVPAQYLVSTDGSSFSASVNIGNLAAGGVSADLWVRRTTPSNAILGLWSARMLAVAGSWT